MTDKGRGISRVYLKYLGSKKLGCKDIKIRKFEFVAKTQFFCGRILIYFCHSLHYIRSLTYCSLLNESTWSICRIQSVPLNLTVLNMKYLQDTECATKLDRSENMKYLQDTECSPKLDSSENMKYLQDTECSSKLDRSENMKYLQDTECLKTTHVKLE